MRALVGLFFGLILGATSASALTFKSGQSLSSADQSDEVVDLSDADPQLVEVQGLLQRFSFVDKPPTGTWDADYNRAAKRFFEADFGRSYSGAFSTELLAALRKRRLVMFPQQADTSFAEESVDISSLGFKDGFEKQLEKERYKAHQFGFTAVHSSEIAPPFCYPTPTDCQDDESVFSPNPHNAIAGDFNGDGLEDLAISWIYFNHTMPRYHTPSHIRFYLNDGAGRLISTPDIYKDNVMPLRHFTYRMVVKDFNGDGVDDLFSGSMGVIKRIKDIGTISDYEPHILLLSDGNGRLYDASHQIAGQENGGLAKGAGFAHESAAGDINCDGLPDIYAGGLLFINKGDGHFANHSDDLPASMNVSANPPKGASLIADFNRDGCGDLVTFDFNGNGHLWLSKGGKHTSRTVVKIEIPHQYGAGNMQVNNGTIGDLNGDNVPEIIVTIHRKNPYYLGRRVVVMEFRDGAFSDISSNSLTDVRDQDDQPYLQAHGEGSIIVRDHDNDGDLDILDSFGGSYEERGRFGLTVFVNDGKGKFTIIPQNEMVMAQEQMIKGMKPNRRTLTYGYPVNIDDRGRLDYVSFTMLPWQKDSSTWIGYTVLGK